MSDVAVLKQYNSEPDILNKFLFLLQTFIQYVLIPKWQIYSACKHIQNNMMQSGVFTALWTEVEYCTKVTMC